MSTHTARFALVPPQTPDLNTQLSTLASSPLLVTEPSAMSLRRTASGGTSPTLVLEDSAERSASPSPLAKGTVSASSSATAEAVQRVPGDHEQGSSSTDPELDSLAKEIGGLSLDSSGTDGHASVPDEEGSPVTRVLDTGDDASVEAVECVDRAEPTLSSETIARWWFVLCR